MAQLKSIRIIVIVAAVVLAASLFWPFFNQSTTTGAALIATPPARDDGPSEEPPPDPGGGPGPNNGQEQDGDDGNGAELFASIYGQVTDLSTGRPGAGVEVDIDGVIVRTDSDGRFSLTGLKAGTYKASLVLPDQATAAQGSTTVSLAEKESVTIEFDYYSQNPPTSTPTNTPEPEPTPTPTPTEVPQPDIEIEDDSAAAFSPFTPPTGKAPAVFINPSHINNEEGVAGNITIDVSNVSDLGAFQAMLTFNPKVIKIEDVILGNFLESTGRQTKPLVTEIDNTAGEVSFVAYTSGSTAGPNGGGTLAVVNFISKQEGISKLDMENVVLVARLGKTINATVGDGRISVSVCFGDLNGDEVIDVSDVQAVSGRVGQKVGDPNYVLTYDLDNDNLISEADVELVTERLYETCP